MLYERAANVLPTLNVCPVENVLGRVPLIQCYLNGNTRNTIPYKYRGAIPFISYKVAQCNLTRDSRYGVSGGSGGHMRVRGDGAVDGTNHDGCDATVAARECQHKEKEAQQEQGQNNGASRSLSSFIIIIIIVKVHRSH